ncbi:MAG TPA: PAS domain S-box protein, partial [Methanofastidiosum sp.]|nr:PAS domain S-box protein [Methanofastidiosum sp.]
MSDWSFIVRNPKGIITHYQGIVEDITERKIAEDRLKSTNKQLEDIIEFLPDATFIIDKNKRIRAWNRAMEQMTGVPKEEILGKDRSYGAVPFYGDRRPYLIDLIFEPDSNISSKYDFVKRKGNALYVEVFTPTLYNNKGACVWAIASPLFDAEGNLSGAIESIRDIDEFKMAEKALRESEEKYRTLFEDSKNPIWTTSREGIILDANQATADLLGYLKDELIGLDVYSLYVDPNDRKIFQDEIEEKGFV